MPLETRPEKKPCCSQGRDMQQATTNVISRRLLSSLRLAARNIEIRSFSCTPSRPSHRRKLSRAGTRQRLDDRRRTCTPCPLCRAVRHDSSIPPSRADPFDCQTTCLFHRSLITLAKFWSILGQLSILWEDELSTELFPFVNFHFFVALSSILYLG